MQVTPLRPGLLVSLKTSLTGNVTYRTRDIEAEHLTADGQRRAKWETERTIDDPAEHAAAVVARGKCRTLITSCCSSSSFGLLCPADRESELAALIAEARGLAEDFNRTAKLTNIHVYAIVGRVAADDAEAVRAISSEVRDLLSQMETGIKRLDVQAIRDAANKAREIGAMLSPEAAQRVKDAVEAARSVARRIVKAGETAATEIDQATLRRISDARIAFLDLDETAEPASPDEAPAAALDLEPAPTASFEPTPTAALNVAPAMPQFAMEF